MTTFNRRDARQPNVERTAHSMTLLYLEYAPSVCHNRIGVVFAPSARFALFVDGACLRVCFVLAP
jgi:hypothetical protein